jgi:23S rRNA (adenine2503-C2)-methyltransferase
MPDEVQRKSAPAASTALFGLGLQELTRIMQEMRQPMYRATQLMDALYRQRVGSIDDITSLPVDVRQTMQTQGYCIGLPEMAQTARSIDGTERYLMRMADGETVETVWMPDGDGGERGDGTPAAAEEEGDDTAAGSRGGKQIPFANDKQMGEHKDNGLGGYKRATICISSQVGCAVNCQFCLTGKLGLRRNLTAGEIAGQVAAVLRRHDVAVTSGRGVSTPARINLVFMGMGEPFLNYKAFMDAVRLLVTHMHIPESRMTVSTSGIVPGLLEFATETLRPKLAVSLNASNGIIRERIMPITRKWGIVELLKAVQAVPLRPRERVTFEYVLLGGVNDDPRHAAELSMLLWNMRAKVNLIVWNPGPDMPFEQPTPEAVAEFQAVLREANIPVYVRRPRGRDIYAACGQLKRTVEPENGLVSIAATSAVA